MGPDRTGATANTEDVRRAGDKGCGASGGTGGSKETEPDRWRLF